MNITYNLVINLYSIFLLLIIYILSKRQVETDAFQNRIYNMILLCTVILLLIDVAGRFDGTGHWSFPILNRGGNALLYLFNLILPSLWVIYVVYQLYYDLSRVRKIVPFLVGINLINLIFIIFTQLYGWYYYIDDNNIYSRGPLFFVFTLLTFIFIFYTYYLLIKNRSLLNKKQFYSLSFFVIPPLICIILQIIFYGFSLILNGVTLSLFILYINIQNANVYYDYLTGIFNRRKLDIYLREKIADSKMNKPFSAIMVDLDDFKLINDSFGHQEGDNALIKAVNILKSCLNPNDFIARYGGDEFVIILETSNQEKLKEVVNKIKTQFASFNETHSLPYQIKASMGYGIYQSNNNLNIYEFQSLIDHFMFKNKRKNGKTEDHS